MIALPIKDGYRAHRMDTPIAVALIGIVGTCAIGGLGFIFTSLRAGIRDNSTRIGGLEERVGGLAVILGRLDERTIKMAEYAVKFEERTISEFGTDQGRAGPDRSHPGGSQPSGWKITAAN